MHTRGLEKWPKQRIRRRRRRRRTKLNAAICCLIPSFLLCVCLVLLFLPRPAQSSLLVVLYCLSTCLCVWFLLAVGHKLALRVIMLGRFQLPASSPVRMPARVKRSATGRVDVLFFFCLVFVERKEKRREERRRWNDFGNVERMVFHAGRC